LDDLKEMRGNCKLKGGALGSGEIALEKK
jgi:hypothetical protein